ncbi:hypothetical protein DLAC_01675 [Tieghemostelium lacteum]|uniref:Phox domain-containing protein n=1 Tax=Tieghemostelium lacteum TaxID=361077 RepID=A0A152A6D3_TIELA|nr:hypothetical protein DLAC_01675 [Tieghemostelium lacteum]|eukprot:KYR01671.1 hypothetical protein DLAC_01675 [Tieghemostelium lacteum]
MDDDDFKIIKEDILLIEQQTIGENNHLERYYEEKRATLVSEEGCIILYYSDVKNKSFETAQFVSISGCKLVIGDHLDFEIHISQNCILKFQTSTFEDKKQWVVSLEMYTIKQTTPPPQQQQQQQATHQFKFGISMPELKNSTGLLLGSNHRNFNQSAPGQVEGQDSNKNNNNQEEEEEEENLNQRPVNNTTVTPIVTPRQLARDLTAEEEEIIMLFPDVEVHVILDALEFCGGDRDEVVSLLSCQTRLSFQELNSYSPKSKSARSTMENARKRQLQQEIFERELERELEKQEYNVDDDDQQTNGNGHETVDDDPQLTMFLSKYCNSSYSSGSNSLSSFTPTSNLLLSKLRVKSSRIQQIEDYYKQVDGSPSSRSLIPDPNENQNQSQRQQYHYQNSNEYTNSDTSSFSDYEIDDDDTTSSEGEIEIIEIKTQEFIENNNQQEDNLVPPLISISEDNNNMNNSSISITSANINQEEKETVQLVIRKKSVDEMNQLNNSINNQISSSSSSSNGTTQTFQWSYKPGSSVTIQSIHEPIGLRSSASSLNHQTSYNQIIVTPPSSPTITPPISPNLLSPQTRVALSNHAKSMNGSAPNQRHIWKPSTKSGTAWDLSVSITGFLKLKDHIEYRIHVMSKHSEWIVYRRYNNFFLLHKKLREMGQFKDTLVSIPPKKLRGTSYQVAKSRQLALQNYLNGLLSTFKGLFYNNSFVNVFLNADVDSDVFQQFIFQSNQTPQLPLAFNQRLNQIVEEKQQPPNQTITIDHKQISLSSSTPSPISTKEPITQNTTGNSQ